MDTQVITPWQEHSFWLEILEDHAYFIHDHLSPSEEQYVVNAKQYIQAISQLREKLHRLDPNLKVSSTELITFSREAWPIVNGYFQFEGLMQNLRVQNQVNLNLTPTYLNGTLSENEEYIRILSYYVNGQDFPPLSLVDLLDLWLEDQLGHAVLARNISDPVELETTQKLEQYIRRFQGFLVQNKQMRSLLRFTQPGFSRQVRLSSQIGVTTLEMNEFIKGLIKLFARNELLTRTTLRFLEHHIPETCYFIKKLSYFAPELKQRLIDCPITKPSFD